MGENKLNVGDYKSQGNTVGDIKRIEVGLGDRSYEALIRRGLLTDKGVAGGAASLVRLAVGGQIAFVSDENVWQACGGAFFETLKSAALADSVKTKVFSVILPPGEAGKNLESLGRIAAAFAEGGLTRGGLVCAMGGGVVGDLAGFAAATWMRGVRYIQIPTSLLAMVDSSVGGKTAVDIPAGKNLLGAFHQPSLVLVDSETLRTLPPREFRSGMAEVIKYGAICSEALFERLERMNKDGVYGTALEEVIADCIRIKAEIVAQDEFDKGRRAILNFGHTFGHAIEAKYGFAKYTHGEAVALGMRLAASYGEMAGTTAPGTAKRLGLLLDSWGLSEKERTDGLDDLIRRDKKAKGEAVELVLLKGIGEASLFTTGFLEIASRLEALRGV